MWGQCLKGTYIILYYNYTIYKGKHQCLTKSIQGKDKINLDKGIGIANKKGKYTSAKYR